jgi:hypothetical protein
MLYTFRRAEFDEYQERITRLSETYKFSAVYGYDKARRLEACNRRDLTLHSPTPLLDATFFNLFTPKASVEGFMSKGGPSEMVRTN